MMNGYINKTISTVILSLVAVFSVSSCSSDGSGFPQIGNPPPFDYVDGEELRSSMHQLAFALLKLDRALIQDVEMSDPDQDDVLSALRKIDDIAAGLQADDLKYKHPFLADNMSKFQNDVDRALMDASRRNPQYYMAGRVSGSCVACHSASH